MNLEEIIRDRASAALTHQRIGFSDTNTYVWMVGLSASLLRATRSSQAATPTQGSRPSMRAPLMCSLAYHTCSIPLHGGAKGRGLNSRPITIHPSLSSGSRPRREPSLAPTRRPSIIIRDLPLNLFLSLSLSPAKANHLDRLFVYPVIRQLKAATVLSDAIFFRSFHHIGRLLLRLRKSSRRPGTASVNASCRLTVIIQRFSFVYSIEDFVKSLAFL